MCVGGRAERDWMVFKMRDEHEGNMQEISGAERSARPEMNIESSHWFCVRADMHTIEKD